MTKHFNDQWQCPKCGEKHAKETLFKQWIRSHPGLESTEGFVVYDCDLWVHRYKIHKSRQVQCLMFVEVKTYGAKPDMAQEDTLSLVNQVMRNRRANKHADVPRRQAGGVPLKLHSKILNQVISCRLFGVHLLTFERDAPQNSAWIAWDNKRISEQQLLQILRLDFDPDTLRPIDLRNHHKPPKQQPSLFSENKESRT